MSLAGSASYNLFARFTFKSNAGIAQMRKTRNEFNAMNRSVHNMKRGMGYMRAGFSNVAMFGAGAAVAIGAIVKEGATFEKQMSVVKSIVKTSSIDGAKNMGKLEKEALRLGRTTSFTAVQAAQGMEQLSRAGFKWHETMNSIEPVLKLAEADTMELATASDIVASSIRAFGLNANQTQMVVDSLAYTSATSNTNVTALGESMRYAASIAKTSKVTFKETVAALGMLGDIGLKGSIAGTALKNALLKINKPSQKVLKIFGGRKGWVNIMQDGSGKMRNFQDRFALVMQKVQGFDGPARKAAALMEIFGLRGIATAGAIESFGLALHKQGQDPSKSFQARLKALNEEANGTASKMASERLNNLAGQWTLFKSAVSGAAIQIYKSFGNRFSDVMQDAISWMTKFGAAITDVNNGAAETSIIYRYGKGIADVIFGVKEGVSAAIDSIKWIGSVIGSVLTTLNGGVGRSRKEWIKLIAKFTTLAVVLGPVVVAFGAVAIAAGGAFKIVRGMFSFILGATGGVLRGLGSLSSKLNGLRGPGVSKTSGLLGKAGRGLGKLSHLTATPVYVVNMPGGGLGGMIPGGAGGSGTGGLLKQVIRGGALGGHKGGLLGLMFGGGFVGEGAGAAGAAKLAAAGTSLTVGAMALAAVAPALTAIWQIGKAHTTKGKKANRKRILALADNKVGPAGTNVFEDMFGITRQKRTGWAGMDKKKGVGWKNNFFNETLLGHGVLKDIDPIIKTLKSQNFSYAGFADAKDMLTKSPELLNLLKAGGLQKLSQLSPAQLEELKLNKGIITLLDLLINKTQGESEDIVKMMEYVNKTFSRPFVITIDGKVVASANADNKDSNAKRGGKGKPTKNTNRARTGQ